MSQLHDVISRRRFTPAAAFAVVPRRVLGGGRAPSDKLNIAGVGVGGMGRGYLQSCESENIVALCDVDDDVAARTYSRYPDARRYRDYRVMLEKEKGIDAVIIGTPDHTHAAVGLAAMALGKHVYCAKPLTRTVAEARAMAKAAREAGVATQMSVQSCACEAACQTAEWVRAGVVGPVREVHVWSDRPVWPQGLERPHDSAAVPASLDWELWLGGAPKRPYNPLYHPFNWRGWYDFGTGAVGDMGCHTLHVIFRALDLKHPASVSASACSVMEPLPRQGLRVRCRKAAYPETYPSASIVTWGFPGDVQLHWYDGGLKPPRPAAMERGKALPSSGILFMGERGVLFSGFSGGPQLVPEEKTKQFQPPPKTLKRTAQHYHEWIAAAKGGEAPACNFEFGSLLTETCLLGTIAVRTGRELLWDASSMRFTNDAEANALLSGWPGTQGVPSRI